MNQHINGLTFLIVSDVIVGKSCIISENNVMNKELYDSAVDSFVNPTSILIPHPGAAYPKYIVTFHTGSIIA